MKPVRPQFAIRLVHLNTGWRYWAFSKPNAEDVTVGLDPNGYATHAEAEAAVTKAETNGGEMK